MVPINYCSARAAEKVTNWHVLAFTQTSTDIHTNRAHKEHASSCLSRFFAALIDPITLSKTANTVPYGEAIEMEIQLFLMGTLSIINLWGERFSRQIASHVVNVHYANVRCREVVMFHEVGGSYIPLL